MIVRRLSLAEVTARLAGTGLRLRLGPFNVRIQTGLQQLAKQLYALYGDHELAEDEIAEIHARVVTRRFIRQPFSVAVQCLLDGQIFLPPVPARQALDLLERSLKLAIVTRAHHFLLFRAAVLERGKNVLLMPAPRYSGKTTLSAALVQRDYRLLSDEFGILDLRSGQFVPMPTALSLGADSITAVRKFAPAADLERVDSGCGTAVYLRPPQQSVEHAVDTARARWVVFPRWSAPDETPNAAPQVEPLTECEMFLLLAANSYNYEVLGAEGFRAVTQLVNSCSGYSLTYSDLESASTVLNELTDAI